jgi:hypothetical protein
MSPDCREPEARAADYSMANCFIGLTMKLTALFVAGALLAGISVEAAEAGKRFHPLRTARDAAHLAVNTAKGAVDLGLHTAAGAFDVATDAVTPDNCTPGHSYRGRDGHWHRCR